MCSSYFFILWLHQTRTLSTRFSHISDCNLDCWRWKHWRNGERTWV